MIALLQLPALASPDPVWSAMALTALLGGALCLDESAVVQSWLSQPLPAALLTGLVWGRPDLGLALGVPLQLILAANLPVGQSFVGDAVTATVAVTGAAAKLQPDRTGFGPGFLDAVLWGWLLLGVLLLSLAGHWLITAERAAFGLWMHEGRLSLRDGDMRRLESLHRRCLTLTFLRGAVLSVLFLLLVQEAWLTLLRVAGPFCGRWVAWLPLLLCGAGLGSLWERFNSRRAWVWVAAGMLLAVAVRGVSS